MHLLNDGSVEITFDEVLSLVVTMYREETGTTFQVPHIPALFLTICSALFVQEKIGNIVLRHKSKSLLGGEMYKGLGIATFSLDTVANNYQPTNLSLTIVQASVKGGTATITVTPKFLGEVHKYLMNDSSPPPPFPPSLMEHSMRRCRCTPASPTIKSMLLSSTICELIAVSLKTTISCTRFFQPSFRLFLMELRTPPPLAWS
jgi:hypothetical protein